MSLSFIVTISVEYWHDFETWFRVVKVVETRPLYQSAGVTIACTIFELFDV